MIYKVDEGKVYYSQRNNEIKPLESCNVTSMVMALGYLGYTLPDGQHKQPEDRLRHFIETDPECLAAYERYVNQNSWTKGTAAVEIHQLLSDGTNKWMKRTVTQFRCPMPIGEIIEEIKRGRPVVLSGAFEQPGKNPLDHIVVLVGYNDETGEVCYDDPYGKTYQWSPTVSGNDSWVSWELFIRDIKEVGNQNDKWAHIFRNSR